MKKPLLLTSAWPLAACLVLLFTSTSCEKDQDSVPPIESKGSWIRKNDFPGEARSSDRTFSIGDKGYIGFGTNWNNPYLKDFWEYSSTTDTWTQKANLDVFLPQVTFSIGNKGYVLGCYGDFYEYDPEQDTWTPKKFFPGNTKAAIAGFTIGGKGYAGMNIDNISNKGYTGTNRDNNAGSPSSDFWEYTPETDTWREVADFPGKPRNSGVMFTVGNKGYFGLGYEGGSSATYLLDMWEYDPAANSWQQKKYFPGYKSSAVSGFTFSNQHHGYVSSTMEPDSAQIAAIWEYTPQKDDWRKVQPFPNRNNLLSAAFTIQGRTIVIGGFYQVHSKQVWEFQP